MLRGNLLPCFFCFFCDPADGLPASFRCGLPASNCTRLLRFWAIPVEGGGHSSPKAGKLRFWSVPCIRSAFHVAASLRPLCSSYRSTGSLPKGEACLSKAGATLQWIPPAFPSRIGFDPCTASALSSEGRGGRFYGTHADSVSYSRTTFFDLSSGPTLPL